MTKAVQMCLWGAQGVSSKSDYALGKGITEQQASGESQIQGVQLQVFASDKAEKLLSSKLPTSQVHDLATGHWSFWRVALVLYNAS